tara:strand:+ start:238 stop:1041 length:804 start_codon:yes stop_codon:yes gene_type:complete
MRKSRSAEREKTILLDARGIVVQCTQHEYEKMYAGIINVPEEIPVKLFYNPYTSPILVNPNENGRGKLSKSDNSDTDDRSRPSSDQQYARNKERMLMLTLNTNGVRRKILQMLIDDDGVVDVDMLRSTFSRWGPRQNTEIREMHNCGLLVIEGKLNSKNDNPNIVITDLGREAWGQYNRTEKASQRLEQKNDEYKRGQQKERKLQRLRSKVAAQFLKTKDIPPGKQHRAQQAMLSCLEQLFFDDQTPDVIMEEMWKRCEEEFPRLGY